MCEHHPCLSYRHNWQKPPGGISPRALPAGWMAVAQAPCKHLSCRAGTSTGAGERRSRDEPLTY